MQVTFTNKLDIDYSQVNGTYALSFEAGTQEVDDNLGSYLLSNYADQVLSGEVVIPSSDTNPSPEQVITTENNDLTVDAAKIAAEENTETV